MSKEDDAFDTHGAGDALEKGLAAAFGEARRAGLPQPSVLQALQARTSSQLGVHLDSDGLPDAPVKVTEAVKALREPAGRYQMLGEIGRGGVGIVYKGRDQDLGRDVAMKVLKDEYASRSDVLARFVEEAQIGGQLQHPGIVPVYELGLHAGERPYFAMKLIKGETLAAQLAKRSDASQERRRFLGIFEQICQTMAYAHARRVVHRDLKPANVMIGAFGEVQVVDWGFAKVLQRNAADEAAAAPKHASERSVIETVRSRADSGSHSVVGSMLGTPAYMPPEQALGDIARVDERSDVFSLGAILCEILTGAPPYRAEDGDLVRQAANAQLDGAHARLARCGADEALITLSKECLSAAQRARPASASELAERVSAYLTSVEERAREAQVRAAEARLKHRVTLWSAAAALLVLALGAGSWIWIEDQARSRRSAANQRVASAMNAASGDQGRAQAASLDLSLWSKARTSAEQLVLLARSEEIDESTRGAAEALFAAVTVEERAAQDEAARRDRDRKMRTELEIARMPTDEDVRKNVSKEQRRLDKAYADVFSTYMGASLLDQSTETVLAALRRSDIEVELAAALDHWGLVRDALRAESHAPDTAGTARIREIAVLLDGNDPWRSKLRALLPNAAGEGERLRELAAEADFAAISGVGCRVLGQALWIAGEKETAVAVLRRGQEQHPTDFDLCFHLALALDLFDPPRSQESLATYRIAHAIRPEHGEVLHRQLLALNLLLQHADEERLARLWVARDPTSAHALTHVGFALRLQGRPDEAIECYQRALSLDARHASAHDAIGRTLVDQGKLNEAIASHRRAIELEPENATMHAHFARALAKLGQHNEAIASYRRSLELNSEVATVHRGLGLSLVVQGRLDEAIASHRRAIALDPKNAVMHHQLGNALVKQGQVDEAITSFGESIELDPKVAETHFVLGRAHELLGHPDAAIASFRNAIELDPKYTSAHASLGSVLATRGKLDEAIASHRQAMELDPKDAGIRNNLGLALAQQGRPDEAIASYRSAIELDANFAPAHYNLGLALKAQGLMDEAIACYRRTIELDPKFAQAHSNLGVVLADGGQLDEAIACYEKAIELDPQLAPPHGNLGNALVQLGRLDEAVASYRRAIELEPNDSRGHSGLGDALAAQGQLDEATACYRRAIELSPKDARVHNSLGNALWTQGNADAAFESYQRSLELDSHNAPARFNLGVIFSGKGDLDRALLEFRKAAELFAQDPSPFGRDWLEMSRSNIAAVEVQIALRATLNEVLTGRRAVSSEEWDAAVQSGYDRKRYREVLELTEVTLRDAPELFGGLYGAYVPACVAALLAASADSDVTADERVRRREQARSWLGREIERWSAQVERGGKGTMNARSMLQHALSNADLASVRGTSIDALPEAEREAWRELWKQVESGAAK